MTLQNGLLLHRHIGHSCFFNAPQGALKQQQQQQGPPPFSQSPSSLLPSLIPRAVALDRAPPKLTGAEHHIAVSLLNLKGAPLTHFNRWSAKQAAGSAGIPATRKEKHPLQWGGAEPAASHPAVSSLPMLQDTRCC
ncbi:unnamed protein product [Lepidochelys olivacea]